MMTLPVSVLGIVLVLTHSLFTFAGFGAGSAFCSCGFLAVPTSNASDRATNLEREIPFAAAYISVMASGGIAPYTSFKRLSEVDLMPAMRKEARDIMKDVEVFGVDPLSALEGAAKKSPLDIFKDFLSGYASTVIIGGDIGHFLERKAEDIFKTRALRVKAAAERLGMLLETFIIVMVMMSLCFYILFAVQQIQDGYAAARTSLSTFSGILMYTYLFYAVAVGHVHLFSSQHAAENSHSGNASLQSVRQYASVVGVFVFLLLTNFMGAAHLPFFST